MKSIEAGARVPQFMEGYKGWDKKEVEKKEKNKKVSRQLWFVFPAKFSFRVQLIVEVLLRIPRLPHRTTINQP